MVTRNDHILSKIRINSIQNVVIHLLANISNVSIHDFKKQIAPFDSTRRDEINAHLLQTTTLFHVLITLK
jgi:hypothetical protein